MPLPAGTLVIGGTYLVPTGRAFRARCQLAADRLGFAVPAQGPAADLGARHGTPELCGREAPCDHGQ